MPASIQPGPAPEDEVDILRSRFYALLARAFSFPTARLEEEQEELWSLAHAFCPELVPEPEAAPRIRAETLEPEYINRFDGVDRNSYCKPYEGLWFEGDRAQRQWEVKKFYRFFGLAPDPDRREMPDHIAVELEFMHFLGYRYLVCKGLASDELAGGKDPNGPEHYLAAQRDFLERHLSRWLPAFRDRLIETEAPAFHVLAARVAACFVEADLEWVQTR